jgi:hypothetical protein
MRPSMVSYGNFLTHCLKYIMGHIIIMKLNISSSLRIFLIIIILAGSFFIIYYRYRLNHVSKLFWKVERNTLRSNIELIIGPPDIIDICDNNLWWRDDRAQPIPNNGLCIVFVQYNFFLESFAFGYSEKGLLTSKYHYQSE